MKERTCIKCGAVKPINQFNFKDKSKGRRNARCKECTRRDIRNAYRKNRKHYLEYRKEYNARQVKKRRKFILDYLRSHPCVDCGIDNPAVLQFDHVRGKKIDAVSNMIFRRGYSMKIVVEEIAKCEIRCANCHAIKTAHEGNFFMIQEDLPKL